MDNNQNSKKTKNMGLFMIPVVMLAILFYFLMANFTHAISYIEQINIVLTPIYAGAILAFLLSPIHNKCFNFLEKHFVMNDENKRKSLNNGTSVFFSLFCAFFVVYILLAMLLPQLYASIENLFLSIPDEFSFNTPQWLTEFFVNNPDKYESIKPFYESTILAIENWVQTDIMPKLNSFEDMWAFVQTSLLPHLSGVVSGFSQVVSGFVGFILDSVIAIIVSVYLLSRKSTFSAQAKKMVYGLLPIKWADFTLFEVRNAYRILSGFINGKMLDSLIIGIICFVFANILEFPYAPLIATIIGITNIIPFFGPFIGAIPCGILILLVDPVKCLYFIIFIIALQQFDGNILGPKILGESTGLGSFWVLFSIIFFGGMFGIAGMILGVPIFATIYSMASRFIKYQLRKKNMPEETEIYEKKGDDMQPLSGLEIISYFNDLQANADDLQNDTQEDEIVLDNKDVK